MDKRLVIITQHVDEHAGLMSFFVAWIAELARHFDRIDVIALERGRYHLPTHVHVHSLGKERGSLKPVRWFKTFWLLACYVPGSTGVFAHMSPIFAILAWPFAFPFRSKLVLWYLHRSVTLKLRLAVALSDVVLTADAGSLRIKHPKIMAVGHGIDVKKFAVRRTWEERELLQVISVGRISPIKDFDTLIRAVAQAQKSGHPMSATIVGEPVMPGDEAYYMELKKLVAYQGLTKDVRFAGYIPNDKLASVYAHADVAVGLTPPGGIDKVLLEAMASGCIVLTSNAVMAKYLGPRADLLTFEHGNAGALAERLAWVSQLSSQERADISREMQESVAGHHDLPKLIQRIVAILK